MLSPAEIAAELAQDTGHGLDLLTADWQGVPERERSMRATLDRSWGLLSEREQGILAGLSVFRGGFTAERAEAVKQTAPANPFGTKEYPLGAKRRKLVMI